MGCTSTWLTRPECPLSDLSKAQSEVRKSERVESSEVVMRCDEVGKWSEVIDPDHELDNLPCRDGQTHPYAD